jgi:hypothetical protein
MGDYEGPLLLQVRWKLRSELLAPRTKLGMLRRERYDEKLRSVLEHDHHLEQRGQLVGFDFLDPLIASLVESGLQQVPNGVTATSDAANASSTSDKEKVCQRIMTPKKGILKSSDTIWICLINTCSTSKQLLDSRDIAHA